jgi:hypothetical protein
VTALEALLDELHTAGAELVVLNGALHLVGDRLRLTPDLRARLRVQKPALFESLCPYPCARCGGFAPRSAREPGHRGGRMPKAEWILPTVHAAGHPLPRHRPGGRGELAGHRRGTAAPHRIVRRGRVRAVRPLCHGADHRHNVRDLRPRRGPRHVMVTTMISSRSRVVEARLRCAPVAKALVALLGQHGRPAGADA